jgi:serine/alanine adding enzyme
MSITIVHTLPEEGWHRFVEEHPAGNIFHTPEMFQVFAHTAGCQPEIWAATDGDSRILALLLPTRVTMMSGLLYRLTTRAVAYGSILHDSSPEGHQALRVLLRAYAQEAKGSMLFTELRNLSNLSDVQPVLGECGFVYEDHLNFLIDLARPSEEIWQSVRSSAKRNIKKARKLRVVIEEANDLNRVQAAYTLLREVYKRIQVPLADVSLFQSAFEILHPQGMLRILIAKVENIDVGAMTLLLYKDTIYYWYTGTVRKPTPHRAGDLLVWHALEWGNQNGFRTLDFGGAGKPDEEYGVRDFKAKFGGTLVNYGRNICVHAPMRLKLSEKAYNIVRRFL